MSPGRGSGTRRSGPDIREHVARRNDVVHAGGGASQSAKYVQARGALRHDLARCLRTGRRPCRQPGQRKNRIPDMINIADRPADADDRAVPGHSEGDLIIGKRNLTAIGTLVERTTGFTMLVHLPDGYKPEQVRDALAAKIQTLPEQLRASLTWDQGPEMRDWKSVSVNADIEIISVTRTRPGNARPTRTPTACCASTSPNAATSRSTPPLTSTPSPTSSTTDPASAYASPSRSKRSDHCCCADRQNPPPGLRRLARPRAVLFQEQQEHVGRDYCWASQQRYGPCPCWETTSAWPAVSTNSTQHRADCWRSEPAILTA